MYKILCTAYKKSFLMLCIYCKILLFLKTQHNKHVICKANKEMRIQSPMNPSAGITGASHLQNKYVAIKLSPRFCITRL